MNYEPMGAGDDRGDEVAYLPGLETPQRTEIKAELGSTSGIIDIRAMTAALSATEKASPEFMEGLSTSFGVVGTLSPIEEDQEFDWLKWSALATGFFVLTVVAHVALWWLLPPRAVAVVAPPSEPSVTEHQVARKDAPVPTGLAVPSASTAPEVPAAFTDTAPALSPLSAAATPVVPLPETAPAPSITKQSTEPAASKSRATKRLTSPNSPTADAHASRPSAPAPAAPKTEPVPMGTDDPQGDLLAWAAARDKEKAAAEAAAKAKAAAELAEEAGGDNALPLRPAKASIRRVLASIRTTINLCAAEHGVTGSIKVRFKITPDGSTAGLRVPDTSGAFLSCITPAITVSQFPQSQNGAPIKYTVLVGG